jgi:hypothetical protein
VFSNAWVRRDSVSTLDALNGGAVALKRANLTGEVGDNGTEEGLVSNASAGHLPLDIRVGNVELILSRCRCASRSGVGPVGSGGGDPDPILMWSHCGRALRSAFSDHLTDQAGHWWRHYSAPGI